MTEPFVVTAAGSEEEAIADRMIDSLDAAEEILPIDEAPGSLVNRVRSGAVWSAGSAIVMRLASIGIMAIVARLVSRDEFGVFGLAVTAFSMFVSLAELGVSSAVARSDLDIDEIAPTVTTIAIVTSFGLAALIALNADGLATALGSAGAAGPLRVLSISVALTGVFAVPGAQLQRDFNQKRIFSATAIAFFPANIVLLVAALHADGAMSFAWSRVVGQLVMGTVMVLGVSRHYWPGLRRTVVGPLLRFGIPLALSGLLSQLLLNVDYLFIGRELGTDKLGLYLLAFNISSWSTTVLSSVLNGMVLPAFSKVRADGGDLSHALFRGARAVTSIAALIGSMTMALATPLLLTVYGSKRADAAPVLSILSAYGVAFVVNLLFANVLVAMGRTGFLFIVQVVALACLVPAITIGLNHWGLVGVGVSHIVVIGCVTVPAYVVAIHRSTRVRPSFSSMPSPHRCWPAPPPRSSPGRSRGSCPMCHRCSSSSVARRARWSTSCSWVPPWSPLPLTCWCADERSRW